MAWNTSADGFGKARLKKFQSMIQAKIGDLHSCFANDTNLAFLANSYGTLNDRNVLRGDYEGMWDIRTGGYFRVYVTGGGHREGIEETQRLCYIADGPVPGNKQRFYNTTLTMLFHWKAFNIFAIDTQAQAREDAYQTVLDWIDWDLFGLSENRKILIPSKMHDNGLIVDPGNPNGYDWMYNVMITQSMKVFVQTGPDDDTTCTGIQSIITGFC